MFRERRTSYHLSVWPDISTELTTPSLCVGEQFLWIVARKQMINFASLCLHREAIILANKKGLHGLPGKTLLIFMKKIRYPGNRTPSA